MGEKLERGPDFFNFNASHCSPSQKIKVDLCISSLHAEDQQTDPRDSHVTQTSRGRAQHLVNWEPDQEHVIDTSSGRRRVDPGGPFLGSQHTPVAHSMCKASLETTIRSENLLQPRKSPPTHTHTPYLRKVNSESAPGTNGLGSGWVCCINAKTFSCSHWVRQRCGPVQTNMPRAYFGKHCCSKTNSAQLEPTLLCVTARRTLCKPATPPG